VSNNSRLRDREFLGQGLAFPLQFDPRGGIALAPGERDIEQAIRIILGTLPGERKMRPEFGCNVQQYLFEPLNAETEGRIEETVREALMFWEPRIMVQDVVCYADPENDGVALVEIVYEVSTTHNQRSIVYPFYITPEAETPQLPTGR
jgi:phage baseplate assembly protein W